MHFRRTGRIRTIFLAEGEGFEPSMTLPPYTLSRRASSTTPAPLLVAPYIITSFCLPAKASAYDYGAPLKIQTKRLNFGKHKLHYTKILRTVRNI